MNSEIYNINDKVTYHNLEWIVKYQDKDQVFIQSGKLTAWVFKSNKELKLVKP